MMRTRLHIVLLGLLTIAALHDRTVAAQSVPATGPIIAVRHPKISLYDQQVFGCSARACYGSRYQVSGTSSGVGTRCSCAMLKFLSLVEFRNNQKTTSNNLRHAPASALRDSLMACSTSSQTKQACSPLSDDFTLVVCPGS